MLRSHRFGAMMKFGISRRSSLMVVHTRSAGMLCCLNLSWFSAFNFIKNLKYACDRKFTEVCVYQKLSEYRAWFHKVIAKISWCSFFDSHGINKSEPNKLATALQMQKSLALQILRILDGTTTEQ